MYKILFIQKKIIKKPESRVDAARRKKRERKARKHPISYSKDIEM